MCPPPAHHGEMSEGPGPGDMHQIVLPTRAFDGFVEELDAPAVVIPALVELARTAQRFDRRSDPGPTAPR